ncbi:cylicin-1 isoform X1 [Oryctolagus cuniculus]
MSLPRLCLGELKKENIQMWSSLHQQEGNITMYDNVIPIIKSSRKSKNQEHLTLTFPKPPQPGREEKSTPSELQITVPRHYKRKLEEGQKPTHKWIRHSLRKSFQRPVLYSATRRQAPFPYMHTPKSPPKKAQTKKSRDDTKGTALKKNFKRKTDLYTTNVESLKTMQDEKRKGRTKAFKSPKTSHENELLGKSECKSETNQEPKVPNIFSKKDKNNNRKDSKNCEETDISTICAKNSTKSKSSNINCDVKLQTYSNDSINISLLIPVEESSGDAMDFEAWFKNYSQNNSKKPGKKDAKKDAKKDDKKKDAKKDAESTDAESGESKDAKKDAKKDTKKATKKDDKKKDAKKDAESTDAESGDSKDAKKDAKKDTKKASKKDDKKKDSKKDAESTDAESGDSKDAKKDAKKDTKKASKKDDKKKDAKKDAVSTDSESEAEAKGKKDDKKDKKDSKKDGKRKSVVLDSKSTDADSESEGDSKKGKKDDKKKGSKKEDKKDAKKAAESTETESDLDSKKGKKPSKKEKKDSKKDGAKKESESTDMESDASSKAGPKKGEKAKSSDAESEDSLGKPAAKKKADESDATSVDSKKGGEPKKGFRMSSKKTTFKEKGKKTSTGRVPPSRQRPPLPPCEPLLPSPKVKRLYRCKTTPPPPKPRYAPLPEAEWIRKLL